LAGDGDLEHARFEVGAIHRNAPCLPLRSPVVAINTNAT
jgi:hypothetical protein